MSFPWFTELPEPEAVQAYTHLISALCEMSVNQKRITAKEKRWRMRNTHSAASSCGLGLLGRSIRRTGKSSYKIYQEVQLSKKYREEMSNG